MPKHEIVDFFENYILKYIVNDLKRLDEIKPDMDGLGACAIPQAISAFAAADLLGYLINKKERKDTTWMSIKGLLENSKYFQATADIELQSDFFTYFINNVRSMLVHRFSLSKYDIAKDDINYLFLEKNERLVFNVSFFTKLVLKSIYKIYNDLKDDTLQIPGYSNEKSIDVIYQRLLKLKESEKGNVFLGDLFSQTTTSQTTESISRKMDS